MTKNLRYMRCARFAFCPGATREHVRHGPVTEEQQRQNAIPAQPSGRHGFWRHASLLAPYRPLAGMLVARASSETKIHCRARVENYLSKYQFAIAHGFAP